LINTMRFVISALTAVLLASTTATAQVGKSLGIVDANTANEQALSAVPHLTPAVVKSIVDKRPFASITELHALLTASGLTAEQTREVYGKIFVHVNLNTGTREEIVLIPGAGNRMAREFDEYRPWRSYAHFAREIGKYVNQDEVARLAQYTFIPIDPNTAADSVILTIPGVGPRMLREFKEYRPWKSYEQFRREIGKYVDQKQVARMERFIVITP
jgi:DNA uptake protein ComE-like DNA-binding protein